MPEPVSVDISAETPPQRVSQPRRSLAGLLSALVGVIGLAALGASAWVYNNTQRDLLRLSTDMAQLRLSMELFARQQGAPADADSASLLDLANRLVILEQNGGGAAPAAMPALPAPVSAANAEAGDCLPTGTRFLVAAGDHYPVCGIAGTVEIGGVDNGFITLADGTIIAAGGNIALAGTACMIGVVSAGEGGMTGYAEIRVTC